MELDEAIKELKEHGYVLTERVDKATQAHIDSLIAELQKIGCETSFGLTKAGKHKERHHLYGTTHRGRSTSSNRKTFNDKMYVYYGGQELGWFGIDAKGKHNYAAWVYTLESDIREMSCSFSLNSVDSSRARYSGPDEWLEAIERCVRNIEAFQQIAQKARKVVKLGMIGD